MFDIKAATEKLINGCIITADNGTKMYTPDGVASYAAFWTRDFSYMVENAKEFIPNEDIEKGIQYLIDGANSDGWIPDRVEKDGCAKYTAGGGLPASPNLDNGCFLCFLANEYLITLDKEIAKEKFIKWKDALQKGIDCLPVAKNGLIVNNANPPHSPYGFTDTVSKTGYLAFESLLLWQAQKIMCFWLQKYGFSADKYEKNYKLIEKNFAHTFIQQNGMLKASTGLCAQTDIWASCYVVSIGFPLSLTSKKKIAKWLKDNYETITESGQIRHLPQGEYWEKTFLFVEKETYQNGAFWAVPTKWFCDAIAVSYKELALKTLRDVLDYFERYGVFECINGRLRKLESYVASATNVYAACKKWDLIASEDK